MSNQNRGRGLSAKTDKPKDTGFVIRRLALYLLEYKGMLLLALLLTCFSNILTLIGPMLSGYAIDAIGTEAGKVNFILVFQNVCWMIAFYVLASVLSYVLSAVMIKISQSIVKKMRRDVFHALLDMPVSYFDAHPTGDIISRISYDIDTINTSLSNDVVQILASIITVIGAFFMMLAISPVLVLVFAVTIPLSVLITRYLIKKTRPLFSKRSASLGALNGYVEEMFSGQKTIKAYNQEKNIGRLFDEKNEDAVVSYYRSEYYGSMTGPCVNFVNNLSMSLISMFGAILFLMGNLTLGNISSFVLYSRKFSGPINEAANMLTELQSAFAAAERVFLLMEEPKEKEDSKDAETISRVTGKVEGKGITFGYVPEHPILKEVDFLVQPGSMTAIVGPTGAGKTTIINLLMRFYDVDKGSIWIDEKNIYELTRDSLRKTYAMVLQDTWLFSGTIYENLVYGRENATMEEVIEAAKAAHIHNFINRLPEGYQTVLSDEGVNISKGQKQLLTIARAMLLDSQMIILDEATSNVDTRTEVRIQKAMRNLMKNKTCFVIAHRLSTIRSADTILVVQDGNIIEQGNHEELMEKKGFYHNLYCSQFE